MRSRRAFLIFLIRGLGLVGALLFPEPILAAVRCLTTEDNILGPFYRPNAPFTTRLAGPDEPGERLRISGTVRGLDCTPLPGVLLDVWQADHEGRYDNSSLFRRPDPNTFRLRGRMLTDANGRYEVETIIPGPYRIGFGRWRPKHIHYLVSKPGYHALTTQLFFRADPYLAEDPWAKESLVIALTRRPTAGGRPPASAGVFDIVLARSFG